MELGKPGPEHAEFKKLAGEWTCDVKSWMAPGALRSLLVGGVLGGVGGIVAFLPQILILFAFGWLN